MTVQCGEVIDSLLATAHFKILELASLSTHIGFHGN
jgi:hypothetical protein